MCGTKAGPSKESPPRLATRRVSGAERALRVGHPPSFGPQSQEHVQQLQGWRGKRFEPHQEA
eukprot:2772751-Pyramimonas_sp.AAC.1